VKYSGSQSARFSPPPKIPPKIGVFRDKQLSVESSNFTKRIRPAENETSSLQ